MLLTFDPARVATSNTVLTSPQHRQHARRLHRACAVPRHNGTQDVWESAKKLNTGIATAMLTATLLLAPVLQASAAPGVGCAKCDAENVAALLVELQESELPALQSNVAKITDPDISSLVEKKLSSIETQVAMLAEDYDQGKLPSTGLAKSANRVLNEIASLKSEMRSNE